MLLPILIHPDPRLSIVAAPVDVIDPTIHRLVDDMLETMYDAKGVGLAATQVNVHRRVVVMDVSDSRDQPIVLINPQIVWASDEKQKNDEGCLSVPDYYDGVERSVRVRATALDRHGKMQTLEADGLMAICIQHELDHLMGKVFVQYLSPLKRQRITTKLTKLQKEKQRAGA